MRILILSAITVVSINASKPLIPEGEDNNDHINQLTYYPLLKILLTVVLEDNEQLGDNEQKLRLVCKNWNTVVMSDGFQNHSKFYIDLKNFSARDAKNKIQSELAARAPCIRHVHIHGQLLRRGGLDPFPEDVLPSFFKAVNSLESLKISFDNSNFHDTTDAHRFNPWNLVTELKPDPLKKALRNLKKLDIDLLGYSIESYKFMVNCIPKLENLEELCLGSKDYPLLFLQNWRDMPKLKMIRRYTNQLVLLSHNRKFYQSIFETHVFEKENDVWLLKQGEVNDGTAKELERLNNRDIPPAE